LVQSKDNDTTMKEKNIRKISGLWTLHPEGWAPVICTSSSRSRPHWKYVGQIAVNNVENILFLDLDIKAAKCEKNRR
jgi:hypothetical protein